MKAEEYLKSALIDPNMLIDTIEGEKTLSFILDFYLAEVIEEGLSEILEDLSQWLLDIASETSYLHLSDIDGYLKQRKGLQLIDKYISESNQNNHCDKPDNHVCGYKNKSYLFCIIRECPFAKQ